MKPLLTFLSLASLLACAGGWFESAQMKRAKEFIAVSEFESARTELRVQLHNNADDIEAKALLMFMRLAEGGVDAATGCLVSGDPSAAASTSAEEAQRETRLMIRKEVLDAGIPTKDWDEYRAVLTRAVTYGWKTHEFPPESIKRKLVFAFCAGVAGDASGTTYLVDHLANDDQRMSAQALLYLVGERAIPSLTAVVSSHESLARAHADATLRNLRLAGLIETIATANPNRMTPTSVRTEGGRNQTAGKYLTKLGWLDANKDLQPVFDAAALRARLNQAGTVASSAPVVIRRATVGATEVVLATVALPSSMNTEGGGVDQLLPAGINTAFLTQAWRWDRDNWTPLTIDGKPSISGADLAVLALHGPTDMAIDSLGPDQVGMKVYRGLRSRTETVKVGWFSVRQRIVNVPRVDVLVFHVGPSALERVRTTNTDGVELDADGSAFADEGEYEGEYEGDADESELRLRVPPRP